MKSSLYLRISLAWHVPHSTHSPMFCNNIINAEEDLASISMTIFGDESRIKCVVVIEITIIHVRDRKHEGYES